jgi:hypothetical protein
MIGIVHGCSPEFLQLFSDFQAHLDRSAIGSQPSASKKM